MDDEKKKKIAEAIKKINNYLPLRRRLGTAIYCHQRLIKFPAASSVPQSLDRNQEYFSLYDSMIISYMSCFVSNKAGNIVLKPHKVFVGRPDLRSFHDQIDTVRDKIIAHNENNFDYGSFEKIDQTILLKFSAQIPMPSITGLLSINNLLECTWNFMQKKITNISQELEKEIKMEVKLDTTVG